ncbi:hypothetical protein ACA910_006012 [Epithemia clementina (nom. ined.)]
MILDVLAFFVLWFSIFPQEANGAFLNIATLPNRKLSFSTPLIWRSSSQSASSKPRPRNERESPPYLQQQQQNLESYHGMEVLSNDPLVYTVESLLSEQECQRLRAHVQRIEDSGERRMTRSNPPQVSLNAEKLWPLPFLSLLAGVPSVVRQYEQQQQSMSTQMEGSVLSWGKVIGAALSLVIVALIGSLLLAYGIVLPLLRQVSAASSRTSVALALNQPEDFGAIQNLVNRVTDLTKHPWDRWEAPVVTQYDPGAVFSRHGDASPSRGSEWADLGGQRIITCICYLNSLQQGEGGETYFDRLDFGVQPQCGKALVFFPADEETWLADDRTTHESLPPNQDKWIVQMFGRAKRVPPPLGLPDSYDSNDLTNNKS